MRRLLVVCALLITGTAHAGRKNPQLARIMSGTAAGVAGGVVLTGMLLEKDGEPFNAPVLYTGLGLLAVAPSAGEFYSGQYLTIGMGVRVAAAGFATWVFSTQTDPVKCPLAPSTDPPECHAFNANAFPLLGLAGIAFIGGVWYDVLDAKDSAERYNSSHGYTLTPTALRGPTGVAPGLAIGGTF